MTTPIEECSYFADWNQHNLDRMPEREFRLLAVMAIADLAKRTEALLDRLEIKSPLPKTDVFTDEQCFELNANQHRGDMHPYTCGNDSRHRPLVATREGWRCSDCDYRQDWAHGVNGPPLTTPQEPEASNG